tara:strand:- start:231 stop:377 length:147 start_codon:yes stop_codon:yes gene_type:complete
MIKNIIDLLSLDDWYGVSENVDIAKGKYRAVRSWDDTKKQLKRQYYGK